MAFVVLRCLFVLSRVLTSASVPRRDQHGERIAGLARADADLARRRSPAAVSIRFSSSSSNPRRRSPSFARTHSSSCARRSSSSTRPPGAVMRAASATARAGSLRVVQRLRQHRDVDRRVLHRQLLELALLPDHVRDAAAPRQRLGARRARRPSDRRRSPATPSAPLRSSGSLRRSRDRRPSPAAAAGRARATTPPSCGPAPAAARRACRARRGRRSSPCAAAALPAAAPRRRAPPASAADASNCACSIAVSGRVARRRAPAQRGSS